MKNEKFSGWSSAKGPFPSRFVVPMRKGGLYLGGTLVEDPLEEVDGWYGNGSVWYCLSFT